MIKDRRSLSLDKNPGLAGRQHQGLALFEVLLAKLRSRQLRFNHGILAKQAGFDRLQLQTRHRAHHNRAGSLATMPVFA